MAATSIKNAIDLHNVQAQLFQERYLLFDANPYQTTFTYGRKKVNAIIAAVLAAWSPPQEVLDVGCGTGYTMKGLAAMGYHCTGVEPAQAMIAIARQENPDIRIEQADATQLPFADQQFDIVLSIEVLRYLRDRTTCLREMARVLKPGGVCIVTVAPLFATHGYAVFNRLVTKLHIPGFAHVSQYFETIGSMRHKCMAAGFATTQVYGCFFGPFAALGRVLPKTWMPGLLRTYEPLDDALCRWPGLHNFTNHLVVVAQKSPSGESI